MQLDPNKITDSDRACVNCKFMVRRWTLPGINDLIMSKFMMSLSAMNHYHCTNFRPENQINVVTGKKRILKKTQSCYETRSDICGFHGKYWQPSERWLKDPKNLFKILSDDIKETS